ncbi:Fe2+ or Zn2+ uptake regulation protein Fur/Zur, partial [Dysosmobacter welbionis]
PARQACIAGPAPRRAGPSGRSPGGPVPHGSAGYCPPPAAASPGNSRPHSPRRRAAPPPSPQTAPDLRRRTGGCIPAGPHPPGCGRPPEWRPPPHPHPPPPGGGGQRGAGPPGGPPHRWESCLRHLLQPAQKR